MPENHFLQQILQEKENLIWSLGLLENSEGAALKVGSFLIFFLFYQITHKIVPEGLENKISKIPF